MGKRNSLIIFFSLLLNTLFAQSSNTISGDIISNSTGERIADCSVFISNTSIGTVSDKAGKFELSNIPSGKFDLIVSGIGFETYASSFYSDQLPLVLTVKLNQKATELQGVSVQSYLKNGWLTWGQTFIETLIGTTDFANRCTIQNKDVVRFRFSEKKNQMTAFANEPIIIENRALGYVIKFQLENFTIDFNAQSSVYLGYPLFVEMPSKSKESTTGWEGNRETAYYGSIMNFIRDLYDNSIQVATTDKPEGFEIRQRLNVQNREKARVKTIFDPQNTASVIPDSVKYYKKIMREPDSMSLTKKFTSAELVTEVSDQSRSLFFTGNLSITYRRKLVSRTVMQESSIHLSTPTKVVIEPNGHFDPPLEIFTSGFWAKYQKLANLLPLNYWPKDE